MKKKLFSVVLLLILTGVGIFVYNQTFFFKRPIAGSNFYYQDILGNVLIKKSECGFIGGCRYWTEPVSGANVHTFTLLPYRGTECLDAYAKDNNHVYYFGKKQHSSIDPATFTILNSNAASDKQHFYRLCDLAIVDSINTSLLQPVGPICIKDDRSVFCFDKKVTGADAQTFSHVNRGFYKDKNFVYYRGATILQEADPASFVDLGWGYAGDNQRSYFIDEQTQETTFIPNTPYHSLSILSLYYAKSNTDVLYKGRQIEGADFSTFRIAQKQGIEAEDMYGQYRFGKLLLQP